MNNYHNLDLILKYFPNLSEIQIAQFEQLGKLYSEWNAKINVISRKDIDELYIRHVLHSLGIVKVISFQKDAEILDVGTGGGFPGIPLAILFLETKFHLVDSIGKKIKVVKEIASALKLTNVEASHLHAKQVNGQYDFVVSRAVTRIKPFYQWIKGKFKKVSTHKLKNGVLYLKGGDLKEELLESKLKYKIYDLRNFFEEEFFETKKVVYMKR